MALEERRTRDYLFGQLLAVAEQIESLALWVAGESRPTTAARLMQRFSDRPVSTWRTIELALVPHKNRLISRRPGSLHKLNVLLDDLMLSLKEAGGFNADDRLSGEFLLGYHCQRHALRNPTGPLDQPDPDNPETEDEGD